MQAKGYTIPLAETTYHEFCMDLANVPDYPSTSEVIHLVGISYSPSINQNDVDTSKYLHHFAVSASKNPCNISGEELNLEEAVFDSTLYG